MSGLAKAKGSKKNRKYTRNKAFCLRYKNENTREKNKIVKLQKHMKRFPNDTVVLAHIERLRGMIRGGNVLRAEAQAK